MHVAKPMLLLMSSATTGIMPLSSCSDGQRVGIDAMVDAPEMLSATSTCDCPAVEPPLTGRLMVDSQVVTLGGNEDRSIIKLCPQGAMAISGGCNFEDPFLRIKRDVVLREAGLIYDSTGPAAWRCTVRNNESALFTYEIFVLCLVPIP